MNTERQIMAAIVCADLLICAAARWWWALVALAAVFALAWAMKGR